MKIPLEFASDPYGKWRRFPLTSTDKFRPCIGLYIGGRSGATSCLCNCEHCFIPQGMEALSPSVAKKRINILEQAGYPVIPMLPDTFADNGSFLRSGLLFHHRLYDQDLIRDCGVAWTSGLPLLQKNWRELLGLAKSNQLSIIALTCHGLNPTQRFIRGGISQDTLRECIRRIHVYNEEVRKQERLKICLTLSIGTFNGDRDTLYSFYHFASDLVVDYVRLNRLIDFSENSVFRGRMMDKSQTATFFKCLSELDLPEFMIVPTLISADMGTHGPGIIGQTEVSGCPGGVGLFAVLENKVYPCVEYLSEPVGGVDWSSTDSASDSLNEDPIIWDHSKLTELRIAVQCPDYDGCLGHLIISQQVHYKKEA